MAWTVRKGLFIAAGVFALFIVAACLVWFLTDQNQIQANVVKTYFTSPNSTSSVQTTTEIEIVDFGSDSEEEEDEPQPTPIDNPDALD